MFAPEPATSWGVPSAGWPGARAACVIAHSEPIGKWAPLINPVIILTLALTAACAARTSPPTATRPPVPQPGPAAGALGRTLLVRTGAQGSVTRLSLEAYVAGAVGGEQAVGALPAEVAQPVLRLQALLSRTYAVANLGRHRREGFDLCADTHCQVYRPTPRGLQGEASIDAAVAATAGQVLVFEGRPIQALYHANCGGHTSAADAIWGGPPLPYLTARPDPTCAVDPAARWTLRLTVGQLQGLLNADPVAAVGARLGDVTVLKRDPGGRSILIALDGERAPVVRGEEFRRVLNAGLGPRGLRSLQFQITRQSDAFVFDGRGFGHGAGLCQSGALARLRAGATVEEVIRYYYPGVRIARLEDLT